MATSGVSTTWLNADGLLVRFGTTESVMGTAGEYEDHVGGTEVFELRLDLTKLGTSSTGVGSFADPNGTVKIPSTAVIEKVEIFVEVAAVGGTSVSMGLLKDDGVYSTNADATGLLNAETLSHLGTLGRRWIYTVSGGFLDGAPGTTSAQQGTTVGAAPATDGVTIPTAYTVGTFTAGLITVRLFVNYFARDAVLT